jgi:hypothetical protein
MAEQDFTIKDMIAHSMDGNATKVMGAFDHLVGPKIIQALADKKVEVARTMFSANDEQEEMSDEEDVDTESQETETEATNDENTEPA